MEKIITQIQDTIVNEMKKQKITYRDFAKRVGCAPCTINGWRNHTRSITLEHADAALKALGLQVTIGAEKTE